MDSKQLLTLVSVLLAVAVTVLAACDRSESDRTAKLSYGGAIASVWSAAVITIFANYSFLRVTGAYGPLVILSLLLALIAGGLCVLAIWRSRSETRSTPRSKH